MRVEGVSLSRAVPTTSQSRRSPQILKQRCQPVPDSYREKKSSGSRNNLTPSLKILQEDKYRCETRQTGQAEAEAQSPKKIETVRESTRKKRSTAPILPITSPDGPESNLKHHLQKPAHSPHTHKTKCRVAAVSDPVADVADTDSPNQPRFSGPGSDPHLWTTNNME